MKLYFATQIPRSFEYIRERFSRELFLRLSAGLIPFQLARFDGCKQNDEIHILIGPAPLAVKWVSLITREETNASGWSFIDEGKVLPWPLIYWKHHHRVDRISATDSLIVDDITYECSPKLMGPIIRPALWVMFAMRPARYKKFFKD
jgi:ligand-binding SRPBCC domain-containing protein